MTTGQAKEQGRIYRLSKMKIPGKRFEKFHRENSKQTLAIILTKRYNKGE